MPVCGALGAVAMSATLGLGTAALEVAHAPNVRLDKKKREAVPEVAAPDLAVDEAERFLHSSLFRRAARVVRDGDAAPGPVACVLSSSHARIISHLTSGVHHDECC